MQIARHLLKYGRLRGAREFGVALPCNVKTTQSNSSELKRYQLNWNKLKSKPQRCGFDFSSFRFGSVLSLCTLLYKLQHPRDFVSMTDNFPLLNHFGNFIHIGIKYTQFNFHSRPTSKSHTTIPIHTDFHSIFHFYARNIMVVTESQLRSWKLTINFWCSVNHQNDQLCLTESFTLALI